MRERIFSCDPRREFSSIRGEFEDSKLWQLHMIWSATCDTCNFISLGKIKIDAIRSSSDRFYRCREDFTMLVYETPVSSLSLLLPPRHSLNSIPISCLLHSRFSNATETSSNLGHLGEIFLLFTARRNKQSLYEQTRCESHRTTDRWSPFC